MNIFVESQKKIGCCVIEINGVEDHIHILAILNKSTSTSQFVSDIKSNSSRWLKTKGPVYSDFGWQNGFGAYSISRKNMNGIKDYILNQKEHHKTVSFKDEFLMFLKRANLSYDEKYLWD